ncbi:WRKY transcription factor 55-like [Coffea arabica]|uniref:WRKY transcription factor 55-like n=1 Tax=Coffea arabica TaxID=13443 RepID=A0A6P6V8J2_COFAR|nr:WRKY transcription factor 55-like [Coffea arabica]
MKIGGAQLVNTIEFVKLLDCVISKSYLRCTHQKLYQCPTKKQVQRLDDDPNIFEVTNRGDHTCHLSSTTLSVLPPLPVERREAHRSTSSTVNMGSSTSGGAIAGPSTSRYGRDVDYPVVDMADVMFNSGSSSSTSIDLIFSSMDDKWPDLGDKKN